MQGCRPVGGTISYDQDNDLFTLTARDDMDRNIFRPVNYKTRITISSECNISLVDYYVDIQGSCLVNSSIIRETEGVVTTVVPSREILLTGKATLTFESQYVGRRFSLGQMRKFLKWHNTRQGVEIYHIDIGIRPASVDTCSISPVDRTRRESGVFVRAKGNRFN